MPKSIQILLSLSIICLLSGLSLAGLNDMTKEAIENQILKNKQLPALQQVLKTIGGAENDLLQDKKKLDLGPKNKLMLFPGKKAGKTFAFGMENKGKGFAGDVGVMLGIEVDTGKLLGIAVTTMSETPGVGTRTKDESFTNQFKGLGENTKFMVKADGGDIDAVSGATYSSRAVCEAVDKAFKEFKTNKDKILQTIK